MYVIDSLLARCSSTSDELKAAATTKRAHSSFIQTQFNDKNTHDFFWLWFNQCIRRFYCRWRLFPPRKLIFYKDREKKIYHFSCLLTFKCFFLGVEVFCSSSETKSIKTKMLNKCNDRTQEKRRNENLLKNSIVFLFGARVNEQIGFYFSSIFCWFSILNADCHDFNFLELISIIHELLIFSHFFCVCARVWNKYIAWFSGLHV